MGLSRKSPRGAQKVKISNRLAVDIAKISVTSPIVITGETNNSFVYRSVHLDNKNNVCRQLSSLYLNLRRILKTLG